MHFKSYRTQKHSPGRKPSIRYQILMQLLFYLIITFDIICNNNKTIEQQQQQRRQIGSPSSVDVDEA